MKMRSISKFLQENRQILFFAGILPFHGIFFLTERLPLTYTVVHCALDDVIPFLPVFVIPYIAWYGYITLPLIYLCFREKELFRKLCCVLIPGMAIANVLFVLFPTTVDFRPEALGDGLCLALCRWIYSCDRPVNVCPSLHCFEAVAIHLAVFRGTKFSSRWSLRIASGVLVALICTATMCIKQHSVIDAVLGIAMAFVLFAIVNKINKQASP